MRKSYLDNQTIESVCADANFAKWLEYMMKSNKVTEQQLAKAIGFERKSVIYWLQGYRSPRIETVAKICHFFGQEYIYISIKPKSEMTAISGTGPSIIDRRADS